MFPSFMLYPLCILSNNVGIIVGIAPPYPPPTSFIKPERLIRIAMLAFSLCYPNLWRRQGGLTQHLTRFILNDQLPVTEILFWIAILSSVAFHKLDAPFGVDIDILRASSNIVITGLNESRIVHQCAYEAQRYLLLRKAFSGYNCTMYEPAHSQEGIGSMLQIVVFGGAFPVTRVFTVEEAYYISEDTVKAFKVEL